VFRDPILLRRTVLRETVNSEKGDVASPVTVLVYSPKDIGRYTNRRDSDGTTHGNGRSQVLC
jgi:hypothetical protein